MQKIPLEQGTEVFELSELQLSVKVLSLPCLLWDGIHHKNWIKFGFDHALAPRLSWGNHNCRNWGRAGWIFVHKMQPLVNFSLSRKSSPAPVAAGVLIFSSLCQRCLNLREMLLIHSLTCKKKLLSTQTLCLTKGCQHNFFQQKQNKIFLFSPILMSN